MFADDDEIVRKLQQRIFQTKFPEYALEQFEDGTSLKNCLEGEVGDVALVVTDNEMLGISGTEIIRQYARVKSFPFILVYGGEMKIGEQAVKDGAFGFLQKPFQPDKYRDMVNMALTSR